jgi:hypothetical protein
VAVQRIHTLVVSSDSIETAGLYTLDVLRRLGVKWPRRPSPLRVGFELMRVQWLARGRNDEDLMRPAAVREPIDLARILVINAGGVTLSRVHRLLPLIATCFAMRAVLRRGYITTPGYTLAAYATTLYVVQRKPEEALRIARVALSLSAQPGQEASRPRAEMVVHGILHSWIMRRRDALVPLARISEDALQIGDLQFSHYALYFAAVQSALAGDRVAQASQGIRMLRERTRAYETLQSESAGCELAYAPLLVQDAAALDLESYARDMQTWLDAASSSPSSYACALSQLVLAVYARHDLALEQAERLYAKLRTAPGYVHFGDYLFYRGLAAAAMATRASGRERLRLRRILKSVRRRVQSWAETAPDFVHMGQLLQAESARLRGDDRRARQLYDAAAQRARAQDFPHHAALAHERRARMLLALHRGTEGLRALEDALLQYRVWGAEVKAQLLERELRTLLDG